MQKMSDHGADASLYFRQLESSIGSFINFQTLHISGHSNFDLIRFIALAHDDDRRSAFADNFCT